MSTINSLGIGSGVLTSDLIDKLRAADESRITKPLEKKIELGVQKEDAYTMLNSLMTTFQSSTSALEGDNLYLSRAVTGNTDAVTVKADAGSNVQNFTITDVNKAEADVWNSATQTTSDKAITNLGAGTMTFTIDGKDIAIDYTSDSTLDSIKDAINDASDGKMTASVLQTGSASYELVLTAKDTNKAISFTDSNTNGDPDATSLQDALSLDNVQPSQAATFKYNGIEITRDTNEIKDLIVGVSITLNENQESSDSASIKIEQNSTSISSEMALFVNGYNSLITNLNDMTSSNRESGAVGIFNDESFVKNISRDITKLITNVNANGNSLIDYGIDIDRYGVMSLDETKFADKFVNDPKGMESFFTGDGTTKGIFTELNDKMTSYTGYGKLLSNFSDQLKANQTSVTEQYDKQKAALTSRYEILTKKFTAYDSIISRANAEFSSLESMIKSQYVSR